MVKQKFDLSTEKKLQFRKAKTINLKKKEAKWLIKNLEKYLKDSKKIACVKSVDHIQDWYLLPNCMKAHRHSIFCCKILSC